MLETMPTQIKKLYDFSTFAPLPLSTTLKVNNIFTTITFFSVNLIFIVWILYAVSKAICLSTTTTFIFHSSTAFSTILWVAFHHRAPYNLSPSFTMSYLPPSPLGKFTTLSPPHQFFLFSCCLSRFDLHLTNMHNNLPPMFVFDYSFSRTTGERFFIKYERKNGAHITTNYTWMHCFTSPQGSIVIVEIRSVYNTWR